MEKVGSMTCLNFCAYVLSGVLKIRVRTGPVIVVPIVKYRRKMPSGTRPGGWSSFWLPVQYVSRKPSDELNVRYGSFVKGNRIEGNTSMRESPASVDVSAAVSAAWVL